MVFGEAHRQEVSRDCRAVGPASLSSENDKNAEEAPGV
jgi:hypothetical protein